MWSVENIREPQIYKAMEEEKIILTPQEFEYLENYMRGDVDCIMCDEE